jgi:hypothetical protein
VIAALTVMSLSACNVTLVPAFSVLVMNDGRIEKFVEGRNA